MFHGFELLYGPGTREESARMTAVCEELFRAGVGGRFAIVAPTHRFALRLAERFVEKNREQWIAPQIFGLNEFVMLLLPEISRERILSARESLWIMRRIAWADPGAFAVFFSDAGRLFPRRIERAASLVLEMKQEGRAPADLSRIALKDKQKKALAILFDRYNKFLKANERYDEADIMRMASEAKLDDKIRQIFPEIEMLIIDGVDRFSQILIRLLRNLAEAVPRTIVLLEFEENRPLIFHHMERSFLALKQAAGQTRRIEAEAPQTWKQGVLSSFLEDKSGITDDGAGFSIEARTAPDFTGEVRYIARRVKTLLLDKGHKILPGDVCVCFPSLDEYGPMAEEVFQEYGIPYNLSLEQRLTQSPAARCVETLLSLMESDFEKPALLNFLSDPNLSPLNLVAPQRRPERGAPLAAIQKMRRGRGMKWWLESLDRQITCLDARVKDGRGARGEDNEDGSKTPNPAAMRESLARCREVLAALESETQIFRQKASFRVHVDRLTAILERLDFSKRLLANALREPGDISRGDTRAAKAYLEMIGRQADLWSLGDAVLLEFGDFAAEVRLAASGAGYSRRDVDPAAVQILGRLEPRLFSFRYFFMGGMRMGSYPGFPQPDILLGSAERAQLGLESSAEALASDRFLFLHYIRQATDRVILTRPLMDGDTPIAASPLLEELTRAGWIREQHIEADDRCYGERDIQTLLGRSIGRPGGAEREAARLYRGLKQPKGSPVECEERLERLRCEKGPDVEIARESLPDIGNTFSISHLEAYGKCPFKYFVERIMALVEPEEPSEEITPLERGLMLHRILFLFYTERAGRGKEIIEAGADEAAARRRIREIALEEMKHLPYDDLYWSLEKERIAGASENDPCILSEFISLECRRQAAGKLPFLPRFFETSFGRMKENPKERDPLSMKEFHILKTESGGEIRLRGKIDRVDLSGNRFVVVDYKTGSRTASNEDIAKGISLQLPLYLDAARIMLKTLLMKDLEPAGGLFYMLGKIKEVMVQQQIFLKNEWANLGLSSRVRKGKCEDAAQLEEYINKARGHVIRYVHDLHAGLFPVTRHKPDDAGCGYCPWKRACRVQELEKPGKVKQQCVDFRQGKEIPS